jgi:hypothetical protein
VPPIPALAGSAVPPIPGLAGGVPRFEAPGSRPWLVVLGLVVVVVGGGAAVWLYFGATLRALLHV